jgi:hypothetical protein
LCKFRSTSNTNSEKGRTPIPILLEHFSCFTGTSVWAILDYLSDDSPSCPTWYTAPKNFWRAGEKEREENINEETERNCQIASGMQPWHTSYRQDMHNISTSTASLYMEKFKELGATHRGAKWTLLKYDPREVTHF